VTRAVVASGLVLWAGLALLFAELRWFARRPLSERLRPYVAGGMGRRQRAGLLSFESFHEAVAPAARALGERSSALFGIAEELDVKLARIHSGLDATDFRVRQLGWSVAGLGLAGLLALAVRPPAMITVLFLLGCPLLGFLALEQRVVAASDRWKRRLYLELPVVTEQIGMLLGAGYSLTAALDRVARRGHGAVAQDLSRVLARIRHGLSETGALREWAALSDVDAVDRLVGVLALNREAADLGRLIAEEARGIRRDVQRELIETMERRGEQVWIPVTVATLLPGVVFVGIPFLEALAIFGR